MDWNRERKFAGTVLFALIVGVVGGWVLSRSPDDVDANLTTPGVVQDPTISTNVDTTGKHFEFAKMTSLESGESSTPSLEGKPTVINFWFSTCEPCRREMPALAAAAANWAGKVSFMGVNPNDTQESARAFLQKNGVTYPNWLDEVGDQLSLSKVGSMPTTFFLDSTGNIIAMHAGELTAADITANLAKLGVTK